MKLIWLILLFLPSPALAEPSDLALFVTTRTAQLLSRADRMEDLAGILSLSEKSKKNYLTDLKQTKLLGKSLASFKVEETKIIFPESKITFDFSQIDQAVLLVNSKKISLEKKGDYWQSKLNIEEALRLSKKTSRLHLFFEAAFAYDDPRALLIAAITYDSKKTWVQSFKTFSISDHKEFVKALTMAYVEDLTNVPKGGAFTTITFRCEKFKLVSMSERFVADMSHEAKNYGFNSSPHDRIYWENPKWSPQKMKGLIDISKDCGRQDYVVVRNDKSLIGSAEKSLPIQHLNQNQKKCLRNGQRHYYSSDPPFYGFQYVAERCCRIPDCADSIRRTLNAHAFELFKKHEIYRRPTVTN
ncbi:MAG: hypothetical protein AB7O96_05665 [Pseudobdellovibrionaceae bacterium]